MKRRRKSLRGSDNEHAARVQRFYHRAANRFERAQEQQGCRARLEQLFEAHGDLSRAYESLDAGGELLTSSKTRREMSSLSSKIRTAVGEAADGWCVRGRAAR